MSESESEFDIADESDAARPKILAEDDRRDYATLSQGKLTPRHRRLAQLAAQGIPNAQIAKDLGYAPSRVSILLRNEYIEREIYRLQERIFEETIKDRMKQLGEDAMNHFAFVLRADPKEGHVKVSEKTDIAKFVTEFMEGKATQRHDIGENMLAVLLDKLDAKRTQAPEREIIELEALEAPKEDEIPPEKDELEEWVRDFCSES